MESDIDRFATNALRNKKRKEHSNKQVEDLLDLDVKTYAFSKIILESILAGSVRGNARRSNSHGTSAKCRCGAEGEDQEHIFHKCPHTKELRAPYEDAINEIVDKSGQIQQYFSRT